MRRISGEISPSGRVRKSANAAEGGATVGSRKVQTNRKAAATRLHVGPAPRALTPRAPRVQSTHLRDQTRTTGGDHARGFKDAASMLRRLNAGSADHPRPKHAEVINERSAVDRVPHCSPISLTLDISTHITRLLQIRQRHSG